ncbi:YbaB/EbfC family nucleoid-associated protein [Bailinhaonella thermotolerans]|uniref:YbaB/EbfC family DNA-binding protein n=1 Tax=Bailinhaonella thermotolerans TaxID=1070861 RepID=A0A3A4AXP2_9ACTN|nr:YbaB/EbfC family nucleoid-associated protein [Bailinhaonella thermotolerans]RJL30040.1 YbaB/EbfC family DNA-binding protein [Bailinhaonella thermotolerans]
MSTRDDRAGVPEAAPGLSGLPELRGVGESPDRLAIAVADASGRLLSLDLDPKAMRLDSRTLAESVLAAVRQAQADAEGKLQRLADDTFALGTAPPPVLDEDQFQKRLDSIAQGYESALRSHEADLTRRLREINP